MTGKDIANAVIAAVRRGIASAEAALGQRIDAIEQRFAELPTPERGEAGQKGDAGERGEQGPQGERGLPGEPGEKGEKGEKGDPGEPGARGERGEKGEPGEIGRDGRDGAQGEKGDPGKNGRDGIDGVNGKDALGFEDLQLEFDGERSFVLKFQKGDQVKAFPFKLPAIIYRGVYKDGSQYERGDTVTFGGSLWTAMKDAPDGKPELSRDWQLSAKRGRDGAKGDPGRDLRTAAQVKVKP